MNRRLIPAIGVLSMIGCSAAPHAGDTSTPLELHARRRVVRSDGGDRVFEQTLWWDPKKTAMVVVDMWDNHWCKGAASRVAELAGPMNQFIKAARSRGVLIVHAPSTTVNYYADTPQRLRARTAPASTPPAELSRERRWGTNWCWPDHAREPALPIDDSDMGCDDAVKCPIIPPWKKQIDAIEIAEQDAITDNGQEFWNLMAQRGIDNVIILGVHLNMCVLGRPVAIRQIIALGKRVVLVRDMTDTMYNSKMRPFVSHFQGTDLVVEHVERHWCGSILSTDLTGAKPFRFKDDSR